MLKGIQRSLFLLILLLTITIASDDWTKNKKAIDEAIKKHEKALIKISDEIWKNAELEFEQKISFSFFQL